MDGDGVDDCPYDFDDKTGSKSYSNTSNSSSYSKGYDIGYAAGKENAEKELYNQITKAKKESAQNAYAVSFWFGAPAVAFLTNWLTNRSKQKEIDRYIDEIKRLKSQPSQPTTISTYRSSNSAEPGTYPHETRKYQSVSCEHSLAGGKSSFISKYEYKDGGLLISFVTGSTYHYYNVPESVYKEMLAAPSKGKFYHDRIKDQYPYT